MYRSPLVPRSRLVAFDPTLLLRLVSDAAGFEPVARQLAFPVDSSQTAHAYTLKVDAPGVTRDQIKIETVEDRLTITIEKGPQAETAEGATVNRQERWRVHGQRQFKLPSDAQPKQISATLTHGVLTITLPRQVPEAPQVHTVTIREASATVSPSPEE